MGRDRVFRLPNVSFKVELYGFTEYHLGYCMGILKLLEDIEIDEAKPVIRPLHSQVAILGLWWGKTRVPM